MTMGYCFNGRDETLQEMEDKDRPEDEQIVRESYTTSVTNYGGVQPAILNKWLQKFKHLLEDIPLLNIVVIKNLNRSSSIIRVSVWIAVIFNRWGFKYARSQMLYQKYRGPSNPTILGTSSQGESIFTLCFWWEVYFTELSAHHITLQFVHIPACFGTAQSGCKFSHKIQTSVKGNKSVQKQKKQEEKTKEEEHHSVTNIFYLCVCRIKIREFYLMIHFSLLSHETCLWSYTVFFKLSTWTLLPHYILFSYWEDYFAASYFYRAIQISGSIFFYILQIAKLYKQPQLHCGCQCEGKGQYIFLFQHGMPEDADFGYLFWHAVSLPWPTLTFTLQSFDSLTMFFWFTQTKVGTYLFTQIFGHDCFSDNLWDFFFKLDVPVVILCCLHALQQLVYWLTTSQALLGSHVKSLFLLPSWQVPILDVMVSYSYVHT
uniref:Uncharacterized protein LOC105046910 isoform X3 n=1 Tax=Elaeis guineensis var. tenera TaxID=51953 RepID=A0A8N4F4Q2_ELAGV|nr:uncharacterized protein LOC105046910 isoform X3 [Elaeis guineensis]